MGARRPASFGTYKVSKARPSFMARLVYFGLEDRMDAGAGAGDAGMIPVPGAGLGLGTPLLAGP